MIPPLSAVRAFFYFTPQGGLIMARMKKEEKKGGKKGEK